MEKCDNQAVGSNTGHDLMPYQSLASRIISTRKFITGSSTCGDDCNAIPTNQGLYPSCMQSSGEEYQWIKSPLYNFELSHSSIATA
jgi:hypothetical protein